jgi:hypothetical protein
MSRRLAERVDRELDADRNFFRRFPHRRYRIRHIYPAERAEFEHVTGQSLQAPAGFSTYVAVEEVFRGARLRLAFTAQINVPLSELREERCRQVFWACLSDQLAETREYISRELGRTLASRTPHARRGGAVKHGEARPRSAEYQCWRGMIGRCTRPTDSSWKKYGACGIRVCDRWRPSYINFLADMGRKPSPQHSIDRIDPDGDYEPSNCRWATRSEQRQHQRPRAARGAR